MTICPDKGSAGLRISRLVFVLAICFALLFVQNHAPVLAQENNAPVYQVGGAELTIPSASNDLVEMGSYRTMMEVYVPDSNRLIAAFLQPEDLKVFETGTRKGLRHYALVEVPRSNESTDISAADFQQAVASVDKQFASSSDSPEADALTKEGEDQLNQKLKALNLNASHTTLEKPVMLGKFFSKTDAYALGMLMPVTSNGSTINMLTGILLIRVKSRVVYCYLYTEYKGDQTEPWMRTSIENWADAILAANAP